MKLVGRVALPILLLIYITVETIAKLNHTSICGSTGCKLAGQLLIFPSIYLNFMGLAAVFGILILGWLSLKREWFDKLFFIALYGAIAFESIMFAYQYFVNPEPCIFCGGVYGGLLLIALITSPRYFIYALPVITAEWIALGTLAMPKNMELIAKEGTYLIHSETCPHCKKVRKYFADHNITYTPIDVHNPNARSLLKDLGLSSIPNLVIKKDHKLTIINGDEGIIEHYANNDDDQQAQQQATPQAETAPQTPPLKEDKSGCGLDEQLDAPLDGKSGCEQESEVPLR